MRILCISTPDDIHVAAAIYSLRRSGHHARFWSPADLPTIRTGSIEFDGSATSPDLAIGWIGDDPDLVLFRKYPRAVLDLRTHDSDKPVAEREFRHFMNGLLHLIAPNSVWMNPFLSLYSSGKAFQLKLAARLGFKTPPTLMSCDPDRIRSFARSLDRDMILKSFAPTVWTTADGEVLSNMTRVLSADVLDDDVSLRLSPAIYQPLIDKAYEIRVTVFGKTAVFARINSQERPETSMDWRVRSHDLNVAPYHPSQALCDRCVGLVRAMGLLFGAIDLIVDRNDEIYFLELNPAGQFVWLDMLCPELNVTGAFLRSLLNLGGSAEAERTAFPDALSMLREDHDFECFRRGMIDRHAPADPGLVEYEVRREETTP